MTGILMQTVLRKLKEREQRSNAQYFVGVLNRLGNEKYRSSTDDKITNTLAEYYDAKKSESENISAKRVAYNRALDANTYAVDSDLKKIPLGAPGAEFNDVELIGGMWRIQRQFDKQITDVRDRKFILLNKLPRQEKTLFEFYRASHVGINCYGPFCSGIADYIVAKYETDNGTYWSYGRSIEEARAFMGIKMYDEYMYLINSVARQNSLLSKHK